MKFFYFLLLPVVLLSCSKSPKQEPLLPIPELRPESPDLSEKVFFIGPRIDSVHAAVLAECDCCSSDMAFVDSTSFVYIERCLGGDVYVKGKYLAFGKSLFLQMDPEYVSSDDPIVPDTILPTTYETGYSNTDYIAYSLSTLKGKQFISYSKDDYVEYGIQTDYPVKNFLKEFKNEKALTQFLKSIVH